jgi:hypothetical protein
MLPISTPQWANLPVLGLPFSVGFTHYADLAARVGEHRAETAMGLLVGSARSFNANALEAAERISRSAYVNPQNVPYIDVCIVALMVELLKTMREQNCFFTDEQLLPGGGHSNLQLPWEFVTMRAGKLFLRPPNERYVDLHPLLGQKVLTTSPPSMSWIP